MLDVRSKVGALLHDDHVATIALLQDLEALTEDHASRPPALDDAAVRTLLSSVAAMAAQEVQRHFAFEEGSLFPLLQAKGAAGMVQLLTMEHAAIRPVAKDVGGIAAEALENGAFTAQGWNDFRFLAEELIERELFHIQKEEMGLLGALAALIPAEEDARLAEAFVALSKDGAA